MRDISEAVAPASITRIVLEADLQKTCVDWARNHGYWARKFSSMTQRSVPDYLFARILPNPAIHAGRNFGKILPSKFACEFKRPGTKPKLIEKYGVTVMSTEAQHEEQEAMRSAGWFVFECNDVDVFKATVLSYERGN